MKASASYPQRPDTHIRHQKILSSLRLYLPDSWIIEEIINDYGVDLRIEIVEANQVTGKMLFAQLKSVKAVDDSLEYYPLRLKNSTLRYWHSLMLPIVIFLYIESRNTLYYQFVIPGPSLDNYKKYRLVKIYLTNIVNDEIYKALKEFVRDNDYSIFKTLDFIYNQVIMAKSHLNIDKISLIKVPSAEWNKIKNTLVKEVDELIKLSMHVIYEINDWLAFQPTLDTVKWQNAVNNYKRLILFNLHSLETLLNDKDQNSINELMNNNYSNPIQGCLLSIDSFLNQYKNQFDIFREFIANKRNMRKFGVVL